MQVFAHRKHHAAGCVILVPGRFDEAVKEPWLFGRELFFSSFFFGVRRRDNPFFSSRATSDFIKRKAKPRAAGKSDVIVSSPGQQVTHFTLIQTNLFWLHMCVTRMRTICDATVSAARSGCVMVPSEWKLTGKGPFPWGSPLKPPSAKMHKGIETVFVQVFHIKPVPGILLNTKDRSDGRFSQ